MSRSCLVGMPLTLLFDATTCFKHRAYVRQITQAGEPPAGNSSTNLSESGAVMQVVISEGLCMNLHEGLRSSEHLRRYVAVEADSGRVVSRLERVLSRSRQLDRQRGFMPFALALASLPHQTSTCLMLNVVGAVAQPAEHAQHVSIGRMVAAEPYAPVQARAAEQCSSVGCLSSCPTMLRSSWTLALAMLSCEMSMWSRL